MVGVSYQNALNLLPYQGSTPVEDGQGRFFFNSLTNVNLRLAKTSTSTVYATSFTSATTLVNGGTCITGNLFADTAAILLACRRKRDVEMLKELVEIVPSEIVPIEASVVAEPVKRSLDAETEIVSSQNDDIYYSDPEKRTFYLTSYTTVTSTLTSVLFSSTTVTVKLNTNFAAAAKITCLPPGWFACR